MSHVYQQQKGARALFKVTCLDNNQQAKKIYIKIYKHIIKKNKNKSET